MLQIQHEEHQKELLSTQIEIQRQTMQHIGREIHDNVGQKLTLASLYTQQLAFENKAPQVNESIENISKIINESLTELRELSRSLTDNTIATLSMDQLVQQEVKKIKELNVCAVSFESNSKNSNLAYDQKAILFRIVQEFLQNSLKHSHCKSIAIQLNYTQDRVELHMKDDGKGFEVSNVTALGIGLNNMQKRAQMMGGTYNLLSNPNQGTQLTVTLPLEHEK